MRGGDVFGRDRCAMPAQTAQQRSVWLPAPGQHGRRDEGGGEAIGAAVLSTDGNAE
jgi:hypothetical protein